ncbi:hypothetical protein N8083_01350 [Candidatus Pacebacteria bacterium]|nr:hypothetical protein [Candidatus Paceibacterota bacterium]
MSENVNEVNKHEYLFLEEIGEPEENVLRLVVSSGDVGTEKTMTIGEHTIEGARPITPSDECYEIVFDSYIAYFILNESYDTSYEGLEDEKWDGKNFRVTPHSKFIEHLETSSISKDWLGDYKHYKIYCQSHVINVVSADEPTIKQVVKSNIK